MATYSTEFDGYTLDAHPTGWTDRWVTADGTWTIREDLAAGEHRILRQSSTADGRRMLSWDAINADADRANVEILARVRMFSTSQTDQIRLPVRGGGSAGSETAYQLLFHTNVIGLHKYVAGVSTDIGTKFTITPAPVSGAWYYLRFRVNGSNLYGKVWRDGDLEPSDWQLTATDTSISAAGWVGVGNFESTGTNRDFDFVSVGTNGDAAPLLQSPTTTATVSTVTTEVAIVPSPKAVVSQAVIEVMYKPQAVASDDQQPWPMMIC